jgi:hypothetical protein
MIPQWTDENAGKRCEPDVESGCSEATVDGVTKARATHVRIFRATKVPVAVSLATEALRARDAAQNESRPCARHKGGIHSVRTGQDFGAWPARDLGRYLFEPSPAAAGFMVEEALRECPVRGRAARAGESPGGRKLKFSRNESAPMPKYKV